MSRNEFEKPCSKFEPQLEDYLSDELNSADRQGIAEHLRTCTACSEAVAFAKIGQQLLRKSSEPAVEPSPFFTRRVMAVIRVDEDRAAERSSFWKPLEVLSLRAAWTASAALILLVTYGVVSGVPARPQVADLRPPDTVGLFPDPVNQSINSEDVLTYVGEADHGK
jgi:anti-sigma factor RsiW